MAKRRNRAKRRMQEHLRKAAMAHLQRPVSPEELAILIRYDNDRRAQRAAEEV